ncbi:MAG: hypothetical protein ABIZ34_03000, partial [Candidatus Limnocylindrales bacterium]
ERSSGKAVGIGVDGIGVRMAARAVEGGVLIGFGSICEHSIEPGIGELAAVIRGQTPLVRSGR